MYLGSNFALKQRAHGHWSELLSINEGVYCKHHIWPKCEYYQLYGLFVSSLLGHFGLLTLESLGSSYNISVHGLLGFHNHPSCLFCNQNPMQFHLAPNKKIIPPTLAPTPSRAFECFYRLSMLSGSDVKRLLHTYRQ